VSPNPSPNLLYTNSFYIATQDMDSLLFWQSRERDFPCLARMARDVLCIPIAGVGVERVFNFCRDICHFRRGHLLPETISALIMCFHSLKTENRLIDMYSRLRLLLDVSDLSPEAMEVEIQDLDRELAIYQEQALANFVDEYISDEDEQPPLARSTLMKRKQYLKIKAMERIKKMAERHNDKHQSHSAVGEVQALLLYKEKQRQSYNQQYESENGYIFDGPQSPSPSQNTICLQVEDTAAINDKPISEDQEQEELEYNKSEEETPNDLTSNNDSEPDNNLITCSFQRPDISSSPPLSSPPLSSLPPTPTPRPQVTQTQSEDEADLVDLLQPEEFRPKPELPAHPPSKAKSKSQHQAPKLIRTYGTSDRLTTEKSVGIISSSCQKRKRDIENDISGELLNQRDTRAKTNAIQHLDNVLQRRWGGRIDR
jgi:nuclear transport factor 2 (NTF2) superfamily protein